MSLTTLPWKAAGYCLGGMQGLLENDGPSVVNVILVLRFKAFGKTQAFRVQDLLEEPGDRTHRDVLGDTFP